MVATTPMPASRGGASTPIHTPAYFKGSRARPRPLQHFSRAGGHVAGRPVVCGRLYRLTGGGAVILSDSPMCHKKALLFCDLEKRYASRRLKLPPSPTCHNPTRAHAPAPFYKTQPAIHTMSAVPMRARLTTLAGAVLLGPDSALIKLARMQGDSNFAGTMGRIFWRGLGRLFLLPLLWQGLPPPRIPRPLLLLALSPTPATPMNTTPWLSLTAVLVVADRCPYKIIPTTHLT
jgi:hypothetical protein